MGACTKAALAPHAAATAHRRPLTEPRYRHRPSPADTAAALTTRRGGPDTDRSSSRWPGPCVPGPYKTTTLPYLGPLQMYSVYPKTRVRVRRQWPRTNWHSNQRPKGDKGTACASCASHTSTQSPGNPGRKVCRRCFRHCAWIGVTWGHPWSYGGWRGHFREGGPCPRDGTV